MTGKRSSSGHITHLHAHADGGRVVEDADGTLWLSFPSEQGGRGAMAATADGHGAWAIRPTQRQALDAVHEALGEEEVRPGVWRRKPIVDEEVGR
jgi:hypothetical protein